MQTEGTTTSGFTVTAGHVEAMERALRDDERSRATREKYGRDARSFAAWLAGRPLTREEVAAWRDGLASSGLAPSTVNAKLAAVNALLRSCGREGCRVRSLRVQRRAFRDERLHLTRNEFARLVDAASGSGREGLALAMETIASTGIRVSELRHVTVEAALAGSATVSCKGKLRVVLMPAALRSRLVSYARKRGIASGPVFCSRSGAPVSRGRIWAQMKSVCPRAGVAPSKVFPHNLRHLFAAEFYRAGRDIVKLADVLGHSSIDTTRIYLVSTGDEHRELLDGLGLVRRDEGMGQQPVTLTQMGQQPVTLTHVAKPIAAGRYAVPSLLENGRYLTYGDSSWAPATSGGPAFAF